MKRLAITAVLALACSSAQAAIEFSLDNYSVAANSSDPGLVVQTAGIASPGTTFQLANAGDSVSFNLFSIWTNESYVNSDDTALDDISVSFDLSAMGGAFGGDVDGTTHGTSTFIFQWGTLDWDAPLEVNFGPNGDGLLEIALSDEYFNFAFFGLHQGECGAADVEATFTLLEEPSRPSSHSAPEPTSMAVWSLIACSGAVLSRRRR